MKFTKPDTTIPEWVIEPMRMLHQRIIELESLIQLFNTGQDAIELLPTLVKDVNIPGFPQDLRDHAAKNIVEKAKNLKSLKNEFLYRQSLIALYSYLEATIKDLVIGYFRNTKLTAIKEVANLKISLIEYEELGKEEKYQFIFEHYEKALGTGIQYGPTRFEKLLTPFKLSGEINPEVSKKLYEFAQVRNNLLHKGGKVDNYLLTNCPWLRLKLGNSILVDEPKYEEYETCVTLYWDLLCTRILTAYNENPSNLSIFSTY